MKINIASPQIGEEEIDAVARVMRTGILAQGPEVEAFEEEFASFCGTKYAVATSNGSTALLVALRAWMEHQGLTSGEVITTPFTFLASTSSIILAGLTPAFADIDLETFNIDPNAVEKLISDKTKAILPVHLYGQMANMKALSQLAELNDLTIIEDCAQAHGAALGTARAGSIGDMGCFSFYPTKNMTTGEGGMITTNTKELADICKLLRAHGMSAPYQYDYLGFNYRMTSISAAIGRVQLRKLPEWNRKRNTNALFYNQHLKNVVTPKLASSDVSHTYHQYTIKCKDPASLKQHLASRNIGCGVYYPKSLYQLDIMKHLNTYTCSNSDLISDQVLSLPVHPGLSQQDLEEVVDAVNSWKV